MLICLDAGHYMGTPGKRCLKSIDPGETREWVLNGRVADKVQARLAAYDCQTMRVDDVTGQEEVTLYQRVKKANAVKADLYLSIHHNAGINGGSGGGIVVYVCNGVGDATSVQKAVYEATVAATGLRGNRSTPLAVKDYYVLVNTTMPAVLGEFGFMDSTTDTPVILTEEYADQLADGIVAALVDLYNLKLVKNETDPVEYRAGDFHEFAVPVDLFAIEAVDAAKTSLEKNYTNGGYFGNFSEDGEKFTLPSGPIVADMKTDSQWVNHYAQERDWLDGDKIRYNSYFWAYKNPFYQNAVSCLVVSGGNAEIKEVEELPDECDYLVSGIPVIRDGKKVEKANALAQGWDNSSMRATSHIFVGLNGDGKIHIIGGKTTTSDMSDAADKLLKAGYTDVIKLDGGGSYEVNTDVVTASTSEDRRIFSVLRMKGDIIMAGADVKDAEYEKWKGYMERWEAEKAALPASSWAVPYIAKAIDAGVMADVGGTIERPKAKVTREELATVAAALAEKK